MNHSHEPPLKLSRQPIRNCHTRACLCCWSQCMCCDKNSDLRQKSI